MVCPEKWNTSRDRTLFAMVTLKNIYTSVENLVMQVVVDPTFVVWPVVENLVTSADVIVALTVLVSRRMAPTIVELLVPTVVGNRPSVRARLGMSMNLDVVTNSVQVTVMVYLRVLLSTTEILTTVMLMKL